MAAPSFAGLGKELVGHDVPEPKAGEGQSRIEKTDYNSTCARMSVHIYIYTHDTLYIPLTISTTKRVSTCLILSPVSWRIQAKKWTRAPVFVVKGRALYLVAAFHLALKNRKCIL